MLGWMDCAAHPGVPSHAPCPACERGACRACLAWEIDGSLACEACAARVAAGSSDLGIALVGLVSVGYLATLALGYVVFHTRPFVGGLAAIIAIALGRGLQLWLRLPTVNRR